jgi:hypothetical protein
LTYGDNRIYYNIDIVYKNPMCKKTARIRFSKTRLEVINFITAGVFLFNAVFCGPGLAKESNVLRPLSLAELRNGQASDEEGFKSIIDELAGWLGEQTGRPVSKMRPIAEELVQLTINFVKRSGYQKNDHAELLDLVGRWDNALRERGLDLEASLKFGHGKRRCEETLAEVGGIILSAGGPTTPEPVDAKLQAMVDAAVGDLAHWFCGSNVENIDKMFERLTASRWVMPRYAGSVRDAGKISVLRDNTTRLMVELEKSAPSLKFFRDDDIDPDSPIALPGYELKCDTYTQTSYIRQLRIEVFRLIKDRNHPVLREEVEARLCKNREVIVKLPINEIVEELTKNIEQIENDLYEMEDLIRAAKLRPSPEAKQRAAYAVDELRRRLTILSLCHDGEYLGLIERYDNDIPEVRVSRAQKDAKAWANLERLAQQGTVVDIYIFKIAVSGMGKPSGLMARWEDSGGGIVERFIPATGLFIPNLSRNRSWLEASLRDFMYQTVQAVPVYNTNPKTGDEDLTFSITEADRIRKLELSAAARTADIGPVKKTGAKPLTTPPTAPLISAQVDEATGKVALSSSHPTEVKSAMPTNIREVSAGGRRIAKKA